MERRNWNMIRLLVAVLIGIIALTGCDNPPKLMIENARAEQSPAMRGEALVYLKIVNKGGKDVLTGIKTDIPGAAADLHEMKGNFMVLAESLPIPAKSTIELMPMDTHIMIEKMPKDLVEGGHFVLTLVFERSGSINLPLTLRRAQPMMDEHEHHHRDMH